VKAAKALQTRQLRDRRQIVEVACPHCDETHWYLAPSLLVECLSEPGAIAWVDRLGAPA
jgi:hypothetical protein